MEERIRQLDHLMGQGRWDEAEELLLDFYARARAADNRGEELSLCNELVGFYRQRQNREGFERIWPRCRELLNSLRISEISRGTILLNGATALASFGSCEEALRLYRQAMDIYSRSLPPEDERTAALYNNMASVYQTMGEYGQSEQSMLRAMDILLTKPHHVDVATTWVNLAQLYKNLGRDADMLIALDRAMERFDDPETLWNDYYAHTCRKCAGAFRAMGQPEREQELMERADMVYEGT